MGNWTISPDRRARLETTLLARLAAADGPRKAAELVAAGTVSEPVVRSALEDLVRRGLVCRRTESRTNAGNQLGLGRGNSYRAAVYWLPEKGEDRD